MKRSNFSDEQILIVEKDEVGRKVDSQAVVTTMAQHVEVPLRRYP